MRNEFRQVERLRGIKCFPGGERQFVGNMMTMRLAMVDLRHGGLKRYGLGQFGAANSTRPIRRGDISAIV